MLMRPKRRVSTLKQPDGRADSWQQSHTLTERQFICLNSHCFGPTVMTDILNCRRIRYCELMATFITAVCMRGRINSKPQCAGSICRQATETVLARPAANRVFWVATPCRLVNRSRRFGAARALISCLTASIKALRSF
jgi:hypothetical protein